MKFTEARQQVGISMYRIKKETGLNLKTIRNIERDEASPRIDTIQEITKLGLCVTVKNGNVEWSIDK